ncbi:Transport protein particle (TRAPP) component [Emericellopsis cladophorae]|uniref:Transport protein particle (TRAPP) component n=1 Tax=Emericellopsis cladophorae TaxID=2686198 RepID=A0A9P9XWT6_9HYPO|nr:Transport protein particle (TRAPP) component [Emericellopsis cladophorae]KAI6779185.1 Transport protein particle (TRAPP) component [Emericellopsis cladophorae]
MSGYMSSGASYGVGGGSQPSGFHNSANGGFATAATKISRKELDAVLRQIKSSGLFNKQLQFICQVNGLKSSGVKADLQRRISDLVQDAYNHQDLPRFEQVRMGVLNAASSPQKPTMGRSQPNSHFPPSGSSAAPTTPYTQGYGHASSVAANGVTYPPPRAGIAFHPSPFYSVEAQVGDVITCEPMAHHRHSVHMYLRVNDKPYIQPCVSDPSYRIMLFCAGDNVGVQHVAFPQQSEIKINGGDFKANLRGLKNKPGSTRPVDITGALRLKQNNYPNKVELTYALTQKKFYVVVYLCKVNAVDDLAKKLETRQRIPKDSVIAEINKKNADPDVVATYVKDILARTSSSQETVTINPNGQWTAKSGDHDRGRSNGSHLGDSDEVEISEVNSISRPRIETPQTATSLPSSSPSVTGPGPSLGARGVATTSSKRPAPQVIDLTLSDDDEDDEPVQPPTKRQNTAGFRRSTESMGFLSESPRQNPF